MFNIYEIFLFLFPSASKGCDISRAYLSSLAGAIGTVKAGTVPQKC